MSYPARQIDPTKPYKLRIYVKSGIHKGDLKRQEYFSNLQHGNLSTENGSGCLDIKERSKANECQDSIKYSCVHVLGREI